MPLERAGGAHSLAVIHMTKWLSPATQELCEAARNVTTQPVGYPDQDASCLTNKKSRLGNERGIECGCGSVVFGSREHLVAHFWLSGAWQGCWRFGPSPLSCSLS